VGPVAGGKRKPGEMAQGGISPYRSAALPRYRAAHHAPPCHPDPFNPRPPGVGPEARDSASRERWRREGSHRVAAGRGGGSRAAHHAPPCHPDPFNPRWPGVGPEARGSARPGKMAQGGISPYRSAAVTRRGGDAAVDDVGAQQWPDMVTVREDPAGHCCAPTRCMARLSVRDDAAVTRGREDHSSAVLRPSSFVRRLR
jgi:hypothetical protein